MEIFTSDQRRSLERAGIRPESVSDETALRQALDGFEALIRACGDDPTRPGMENTPFRALKAFLEYTKGYEEIPAAHLDTQFEAPSQDLVLVRDIEFFSLCEHHLAPFFGKCHVAYIPGKTITGLSKLARVTAGFARRFQVQERMTAQIADAVMEKLRPQGVICVIEATHMCMAMRGATKPDAVTTTSAIRGIFNSDSDLRAETMNLMIKGK